MVAAAEEKTGAQKELLFFWTAGTLSLVLDNAPTYVVFFETAKTLTPEPTGTDADGKTLFCPEELAEWKAHSRHEFKPVSLGKSGYIDHYLLIAVALGTVFMGGMTYIANGPNFMVKAIAEHAGVNMPSFFGYMIYSCLILFPVVILTSLFFV